MDLVGALATKEFIVAAVSVAANIALWRALQKERDERISDLHKGYDREARNLELLRDFKEVVVGLRSEIAAWREADARRKESRS